MGNLMGISTRIDERGRVTIPKEIREALGLKTDEKLLIERIGKKIILRPRISEKEFREKLEGCITETNQVSRFSPERLKEIWGVRHDHD